MKSSEIRSRFLSYFEKNGHSILPSSSLIPHDDPTLLFNNAGMNQFKSVFLGTEKPKTKRATTSQKCVRAGGKHNDLDNVGFTARHHTFFEMLGNFSFGDYFKEEAIVFAWEFLTKELGLDKERLYVTGFDDDQEAEDLWKKKMGIKNDHFKTFGEKDNFWRMGDVGPCGPCSEIFYDLGPEMGSGPENTLGGEGDRFVEIWNLVFMQYEESKKGLTPLPNPSIDTGMGLERISMCMQETKSNYETDLFMPLINLASDLTKTNYDPKKPSSFNTASLRVLADHTRAVSFLIADGVLPSNEGRGYVLRRILRRAVRFNRKLNTGPILSNLSKELISNMSEFYPELKEREEIILSNVQREEEKFLETLDNGEEILDAELKKVSNKTLSGDVVFKLYDTFGFPADLTEIIAKEKGYKIDTEGFNKTFDKAREKARKGRTVDAGFELPVSLKESVKVLKPTDFSGYSNLEVDSEVLEIHTSKGKVNEASSDSDEIYFLISEKTPFYAESGGQVGDQGIIKSSSAEAKVIDCKKLDTLFIHSVKILKGSLKENDSISLKVDANKRALTTRNHSATHLMHAALRTVIGESVQQAGSLVDSEKLRFDFSHQGPVSKKHLEKIENIVNQEIARSESVATEIMDFDSAKKSGAVALFGEKYSDKVRVLSMGEFSKELCGGTHVTNTNEIGLFKIVQETGVSSGVRRIEALTSIKAFEFLSNKTKEYEMILEELNLSKSSDFDSAKNQVLKLKNQINDLKKKNKANSSVSPKSLYENALNVNGIELVVANLPEISRNDLRELSDGVRDHLKKGVVVLTGEPSEKGLPIVIAKTKTADKMNCGDLLKSICKKLGGKGGGRPDFSQGNIETTENLKDVVAELL